MVGVSEIGQLEMFAYPHPSGGLGAPLPVRASGTRPSVGLRVRSYMDGTVPTSVMYLCGPGLEKHMPVLRTMKQPAWETEYVEAESDCRVRSKVVRRGGLAIGDVQQVIERLRSLGIPAELDQPGDPQVDGPLVWGSPDAYGAIRTERVAPIGGYYVITPTAAGLWSAHFKTAGTHPVMLTIDSDGPAPERGRYWQPDMDGPVGVRYTACRSLKACKRLVEKDWERSNQRSGFVYEDWNRGDRVVERGLVRWKGKGKMPPVPLRIFYDLLLAETEEGARAIAAKSRTSAVAPSVSVRAKPVRVYEWDVEKDARLKRPYFERSDVFGAYALSPEGSRGMLTRWSKNL